MQNAIVLIKNCDLGLGLGLRLGLRVSESQVLGSVVRRRVGVSLFIFFTSQNKTKLKNIKMNPSKSPFLGNICPFCLVLSFLVIFYHSEHKKNQNLVSCIK